MADANAARPPKLVCAHDAWGRTPHVASQIDAGTGGRLIAANLLEFAKTGTCNDVADAARGY